MCRTARVDAVDGIGAGASVARDELAGGAVEDLGGAGMGTASTGRSVLEVSAGSMAQDAGVAPVDVHAQRLDMNMSRAPCWSRSISSGGPNSPAFCQMSQRRGHRRVAHERLDVVAEEHALGRALGLDEWCAARRRSASPPPPRALGQGGAVVRLAVAVEVLLVVLSVTARYSSQVWRPTPSGPRTSLRK